MRRHHHAISAVLAVAFVLFATACGSPSESPDAIADQTTATPTPTPTETPCIVGKWKFESATHKAPGDWWDEPTDIDLSGSAGFEDLDIKASGTYTLDVAYTLSNAGPPLRQLLTTGLEKGDYRLRTGVIYFTPAQTTMAVDSVEGGVPLKTGQARLLEYSATFTCEGDELTLRRDSGRRVTHFSRA